MNETCNLITVIVNKGFSGVVMDTARENGATGGTILSARGTGGEKAKKFYTMTIQEEKEIVLILVKSEMKNDIMSAIATITGIDTPGCGIIFAMPVEETLGLNFTPFSEQQDGNAAK